MQIQLAQNRKLGPKVSADRVYISHAPRLRAQQQREAENAAMAELEQRSAPLLWMVVIAAVLVSISLLGERVAQYFGLAGGAL